MNEDLIPKNKPLEALEQSLKQLKALDLSPEAQAVLENALHSLQDAKEEKSQFVSNVSHELRIPMTSIMGYTDLLRQGAMGEVNANQLNFLNVIRENV
jgi:signal transduction histidine kinase